MSSKSAKETLTRLAKAGILIRTNSGQVFFITQEEMNAFLLPEDFQIGGVGSSSYFPELFDKDKKKRLLPTGDNFAEALDAHQKLGGLSGLRNAAYLPNGLMGTKGLTANGMFPIEDVKGGKPIDDLPDFIPTPDP